ncbi:MAG: adenosylcobinamide-GDP ribazoletransferase [Chloroflexi bacterium]|nr:adenosylcobinamide-GDP ribazoletransferase [Chloroflexota bacterium]
MRILPGLIAPFTLAAVLARWLIIIVARQRPARPGGLGADFALGLTPLTLTLAALIPLALIVSLTFNFDGWRILRAVLFAHLVTFAVIALARARLGGVTGDALGRANQRLAVQAGEVLFMVAGLPLKLK